MKNSTKWFLIISAILLFIGGGCAIIFTAFFLEMGSKDVSPLASFGDKIALVELKGTILASEDMVRQIKKYREDHSIKAILLRIDSPGGGVVASQEIYEEVKKTRDDGKPVVASMGSVAASGGYYVACGATRIIANKGTLTGSIGVISQFMRFDPLLDKIGVGVNTIKSGKFKDAGNPFRQMTADDRSYFQNLMNEVHGQFISVVEKERKLDHDSVIELSDGRVFTGVQALDMHLVDTIGTYEDAVKITARLAGIKGKPVIVKEYKRGFSIIDQILGETKIGNLFGLKDELINQPILQYKMIQGF